MLAALALVLLVVCATEGRIINKCELKARLDAAQLQQITIMEEKITVNSLIARREILSFSLSLQGSSALCQIM